LGSAPGISLSRLFFPAIPGAFRPWIDDDRRQRHRFRLRAHCFRQLAGGVAECDWRCTLLHDVSPPSLVDAGLARTRLVRPFPVYHGPGSVLLPRALDSPVLGGKTPLLRRAL